MSTKNKTKNLKLPQYQNDDLFDMKEVNEAYKIIDESYKEQNDNYKQAIETSTINGAIDNLELIDARKGKRTLGEKISEIDSQLETKVNKNDLAFVNVKDFGAIGDGVADDTEALQNAINYARENNGGTVLIPNTNNFYKITSNLYVEGFGGSDSSSITIKGEEKTASKIKVFGKSVDTILSVITNGYNVKICNLTLDGSGIANGIKAETAFAISSIKNIIMQNVKDGLTITNGSWVSEYENILIRHCENGINFGGGCTSIFLKNSYVFNCVNIGYRLSGTYSTGVNLCADICGTPYVFNYADWHITSLGNESSECEKILTIENSNVTIDNVRFHNPKPSISLIYGSVNVNLKIKNLTISNNENILKLYEFGYGSCNIEIEQIQLLNSAGITKDISHLANRQPCYYKEGDLLVRQYTSEGDINYRTPFLIGNGSSDYNITWCDNKPHIIDGKNYEWLNAMPKGTIYLCQTFNNKGVVGFVRSDDKGNNSIYRDCEFLPIGAIISGISDNRPSTDLITGQCYFDKTLGKPIWYNGTNWVDYAGIVV